MHFVDMPRFRLMNKPDLNNPLHRWMAFLNQDSPETILKEVIKMDQAIQQANEKLAFVSQDKETQRIYQMREMALCDITSGINHAKREGIAEGETKGRIEGKIEGKIEIARKAVQAGLSMETIRDITGLTYDVLDDLK
jgi:predicted transposase/invertase (TIGR01784 family)